MSLVAVYNALKAAAATDDNATAAVEALEASLDEPWKRGIEKEIAEFRGETRNRLARVEVLIGVLLLLNTAMFLRAFWP